MATGGTSGQLDLFGDRDASGAVSPLIGRQDAGLRRGNIDSANDRSSMQRLDYAWYQNFGNGTRTTGTRTIGTGVARPQIDNDAGFFLTRACSKPAPRAGETRRSNRERARL